MEFSEPKYVTMTGAEFDKQMANTKLYKLLNSDLKHYEYTYEPNALNSLDKTGEVFNPDPNCKPGGLYFTAESVILKFVDCVAWTRGTPLIVRVEIPADAQISIGKYKIKTDKLILGQPIPFDEFFSDEYISKMSVDDIDVDDWRYTKVWQIMKKQYLLNPPKFDTDEVQSRKRRLMIHAIRKADVEFLNSMLVDVQKIMAHNRHVSFLAAAFVPYSGAPSPHSSVGEWFKTHFPGHVITDLLHRPGWGAPPYYSN